eukprot:CAMPEP_0174726086 /NCGR_PEP_ID=MMETSP1094-20130205/47000_1 /TAXON_ID=156173 /ORGANISM="Chrysochromulina brevifilum, Strain UTEX LB 985" /LENGTH=84 /DNA_ID=CAMNT_0015927603 /DNA_START=31 /DNA_END=285 /DNA_ORIENTATION=-
MRERGRQDMRGRGREDARRGREWEDARGGRGLEHWEGSAQRRSNDQLREARLSRLASPEPELVRLGDQKRRPSAQSGDRWFVDN